jgi:hypothetical protein
MALYCCQLHTLHVIVSENAYQALLDPPQPVEDLPINGRDISANTHDANIIESITKSNHENFIYMETAVDIIMDYINYRERGYEQHREHISQELNTFMKTLSDMAKLHM